MHSTALYTAAQVRRFDRSAIEHHGIAGYALMQRAAAAAWRYLRRRWPHAQRIVVLCGSGNNGGDGYALARIAREAGAEVGVIALAAPRADSDAARTCADWRAAGGAVQTAASSPMLPDAEIYIDALFGTGLTRPVEGAARVLIERLNASGHPVLALDLPSGIDSDSGAVLGVAVRAAATVSFVAHKRGLFTGSAPGYCGDLVLERLGIPESIFAEITPDANLIDARMFAIWLAARPRDAHKGMFGHVLAIGGDTGMGGAIRLAGEAALRVGAGLVSVATHAEHVTALNSARPELMAHGITAPEELDALLRKASVVALGPGLGLGVWSEALWQRALTSGKPMVLDADALNLLAQHALALPAHAVMTPHPGEAARLLGVDTTQVQRDRYAAVRTIAHRYGAIAVLKGAGTLIATPTGEVVVCPWGNPGMASAGMGDVLTGVIAGLLAQGLDPWRAAQLGVALHAQAADAAAVGGEAGLIASDLFAPLRALRNGLATHG